MAVLQSEGRILSTRGGLPGAPWWNTMGRLEPGKGLTGLGDYQAIYRTQPNVRTVISFLARNIAQIGLHGFRRRSATERDRLEPSHEVSRTIRRPDIRTTRYRWLENYITDLAIAGNHFSAKIRADEDGGSLKLLRIPPQHVRPGPGAWARVSEWIVNLGEEKISVPADAMLHVQMHNPEDPRFGLSPLESLRRILDEEESAGRYREAFWKNAARIEGVLEHPDRLSSEAAARLRSSWESVYGGEAGTGKTAILEEGMKFTPMSWNAKDAQYLETRKLSREEVASAFHVSPAMVGILEHANFANIEQQHRMLYQDTLGPWLVLTEEEFELQVLPDIEDTDDVYVEFNIHEKLKGSFEEETKALQSSVGGPWLTRNEARARRNLPPVPGGDELIVPLNVIQGGQASPTDSDSTNEPKSNGHRTVVLSRE